MKSRGYSREAHRGFFLCETLCETFFVYFPVQHFNRLFFRFVVAPYIDATQSDVISMGFAFGRTVIVSAVGSIPEIVKNGENGLLVSPGSTNELADKMIKLANNDDLRLRLEKGALKTSADTNLNYREKILKIVTKVYCEN